jgi:SLT domain-containing protein
MAKERTKDNFATRAEWYVNNSKKPGQTRLTIESEQIEKLAAEHGFTPEEFSEWKEQYIADQAEHTKRQAEMQAASDQKSLEEVILQKFPKLFIDQYDDLFTRGHRDIHKHKCFK